MAKYIAFIKYPCLWAYLKGSFLQSFEPPRTNHAPYKWGSLRAETLFPFKGKRDLCGRVHMRIGRMLRFEIRPCLALLCFCLANTACIDVIDLDAAKKTEEILIVEGTLHLNTHSAEVKLSQAASFVAGPEGVELPVSGASVKIKELGGPVYELLEQEKGMYRSLEPIGEVGNSYILEIETNDNSYTSLLETMPPIVPIQTINYKLGTETFTNAIGNIETHDIISLRASANLPQNGEGVFLRYRTTGNYQFNERPSIDDKICYVEEQIDFNQVSIVDGHSLNGGILRDEPFLTKTLDYRFVYDYCFTVVQLSITENEYEFWNSVKNEFERTGDIFEKPPAKINGNVFNNISSKNDVIGLFSVIASDTLNFLTHGHELGLGSGPCLGFPPPAQGSPCYNCLITENSSYTKPACF